MFTYACYPKDPVIKHVVQKAFKGSVQHISGLLGLADKPFLPSILTKPLILSYLFLTIYSVSYSQNCLLMLYRNPDIDHTQ